MNNKKYKDALYKVRKVTDLKDIITSSTKMFSNNIAYLEKDRSKDKFMPITYKKVKEDLDALGTKLIDIGLRGEKIAVIGETSYSWILTYFTVVSGVGVIVPLDKNLPNQELIGLVERSKVKAIVYSGKSEKSIRSLYDNPLGIKHFISMDKKQSEEDIDNHNIEFHSLGKLIDEGRVLVAKGDKSYINTDVDPDEMATLMYTSGTTGLSKGVMLSQRNIASNVQNMSKMFKIPEPGIVLSILPVHHAYEMTCDIWTTFYQGKTIAICQGLRYIQKNMAEVHANCMLGVPLVFEKMYKGMFKQAESRGEAEKLKKAIALSKKLKLYNNRAVVKRMFKSIHQSFGGEMKQFVAGGAAIDPKVIEDFEAMGFNMIQGYGMSENSPIICVNKDRYSNAASVGLPMPETDVRVINSDEDGVGEIICRGPSVMLGYYNDTQNTEEVLHNGWLHTGDLGYIDKDGFVYLTGRKKTVIVTKGGKNIFPEEVETVLLEDDHIKEVLVYGVTDSRVGNVMITADIYPNYELLKKEKGDMTSAEIYHFYKALVDVINKSMPKYKQVKRINIRTEEFVKTTTGKIKRFGNSLISKGADSRGRASFNSIREGQIKRARKKVEEIKKSRDPFVLYKDMSPITDIKNLLETSVEEFGDNVAFCEKVRDDMPAVDITYKQLLVDVNGLGTALINRGLKDCRIAIAGRNSYEWAVSYLAILGGSGVCVPIDKSQIDSDIKRVIKETEVECVIFDEEYEDRFSDIMENSDNKLSTLISIGRSQNSVGENILSWKTLLKEGQNLVAQGDRQFLDAEITSDDMSIICYTAGTTGRPKGVMLSQENICDNLMSLSAMVKVEPSDLYLSVIPLHRIFECTCGLLIPLYKGATVAFCEDVSQVYKRLKEFKPTMLLLTSDMTEKLKSKVLGEMKKEVGEGYLEKLMKLNRFAEKSKLKFLKPFKKRIAKIFGGNLRLIITLDGKMDPDVLEFFNEMGLLAIKGYGISECSPMVAINPDQKGKIKKYSEGHLLPGMDVKVVSRNTDGIGEIVVKGENVMLGYYDDPSETEKVLKDGWFYTGDLGFVDDDKFIYVMGKKENSEGLEKIDL